MPGGLDDDRLRCGRWSWTPSFKRYRPSSTCCSSASSSGWSSASWASRCSADASTVARTANSDSSMRHSFQTNRRATTWNISTTHGTTRLLTLTACRPLIWHSSKWYVQNIHPPFIQVSAAGSTTEWRAALCPSCYNGCCNKLVPDDRR